MAPLLVRDFDNLGLLALGRLEIVIQDTLVFAVLLDLDP
jgi:hypothetical protein